RYRHRSPTRRSSDRMAHRYGLPMTHAIQRGDPIRAGLYELKTARNLSGSQCIYLPFEVLQAAPVHVFAAGNRPMDIWLSQWLHRSEEDTSELQSREN